MTALKLEAGWIDADRLPGWYAALCTYGEGENTLEAVQWDGCRWLAPASGIRMCYISAQVFKTRDEAIDWGHDNDPDW